MALRHAVLAALLDGEFSGCQLAKGFDVGMSNFWHALPQQPCAELTKLESDGLVAGREVVQEDRPNKRLFRVTDDGLAELERFAARSAKPPFIRDDLMVKVQAVDSVGAKLRGCAQLSRGKYRPDDGAPANVAVCGKRGAVYWKADMDVNCDGRPSRGCNRRTDRCTCPPPRSSSPTASI